MPRSELVRVRAEDLEPGRRVKLPHTRSRELAEVVYVTHNEAGSCILDTDLGVYVCSPKQLIDAEDEEIDT